MFVSTFNLKLTTMETKNVKVKKTYYGESKHDITTTNDLEEFYNEKGESKEWINYIIEALREGSPVNTRFCFLEPITE